MSQKFFCCLNSSLTFKRPEFSFIFFFPFRLGPEELRRRDEQEAVEEQEEEEEEVGKIVDEEEVERKAMERVRRYQVREKKTFFVLKRCVFYKFVLMLYFQVNRLKYFYAVAEFDSAESANKVGYKLEISLEIILQMIFF